MNNIEVKWLEDFLSLSVTKSFSRSAQARHVTQPAFSRRIRALERNVGVALIDRSSTPVQLTQEGQLFLITARNVVDQLSESINYIRGLSEDEEPTIDFAAAHALSLSMFPSLIQSLKQEVGEFSTRLVATNVDDAVQALRQGLCDFLLAFHDPRSTLQLDSQTFPSVHLSNMKMLPVCSPDDEGRPLFDLDDEQSQTLPYLSYTQDAFLGRSVSLLLKNKVERLKLKKVYETAMADGLKGMALGQHGLAWIPEFSIGEELSRGRLVRCGGPEWDIDLEIRLYRCNLVSKPSVMRLWQTLLARYQFNKPAVHV